MINIGICDDEMGIRIFLGCVIADYFMKKGLLCKIHKYETGLELIHNEKQLDILFLDITMPGLDGIETGKKLREKDIDLVIVYVTAHEYYALQAFAVQAFDYLIKPIEQDKLYKTLDHVLNRINANIMEESQAILNIKSLSILANEIDYVEVQGHQLVIQTISERHKVKSTLKEIEDRLENFGFERIRRGVWVNPINVEKRENEKIIFSNDKFIMLG